MECVCAWTLERQTRSILQTLHVANLHTSKQAMQHTKEKKVSMRTLQQLDGSVLELCDRCLTPQYSSSSILRSCTRHPKHSVSFLIPLHAHPQGSVFSQQSRLLA